MPVDLGDVEITLAAETMRLKVSPYGASLRGLWREEPDGTQREIVTVYTGANGKSAGQGDVLIPFPGRVREGRYTFDGETHQMVRNDHEAPGSIHGFLRTAPWEVTEQSERAVTFSVTLAAGDHPGYPFTLRAHLTYEVTPSGMLNRFLIENIGDRPAPVAAGFHPYFTVGSEHIDSDTLQVPMESILEFEGLLPTGNVLPVAGSPYDFRSPRTIGATTINHCFLNPIRDADGLVRVRLSAPDGQRAVTVWMDAGFDYVVLYSGDPLPDTLRRRSLAIEAMTCASDGFNHPEWGLIALAPGERCTGAWGVEG